MICPQCGNLVKDSSNVCTECGTILRINEPYKKNDVRQGRSDKASGYAERTFHRPGFAEELIEVLPNEANRSDLNNEAYAKAGKKRRSGSRSIKSPHSFMINWALIWTIMLVLVILVQGLV